MNSTSLSMWKRQAHDSTVLPSSPLWPRGGSGSTSMLEWRRELRARARAILGTNGVSRFEEFCSYRRGWDFGQGKALTRSSILRMEVFLKHYSTFHREPSLFLTQRGNLMLGWEDESNNPIELEFAQEGYALYLAATDEERTYHPSELELLLQALPLVNAHGAP